jgi:hypothetical protein
MLGVGGMKLALGNTLSPNTYHPEMWEIPNVI